MKWFGLYSEKQERLIRKTDSMRADTTSPPTCFEQYRLVGTTRRVRVSEVKVAESAEEALSRADWDDAHCVGEVEFINPPANTDL